MEAICHGKIVVSGGFPGFPAGRQRRRRRHFRRDL